MTEPRKLSVKLEMPKHPVSTGGLLTFSVVVKWGEYPVVATLNVSIINSHREIEKAYTRNTSQMGIANENWLIPVGSPLGTYAVRVQALKDGYEGNEISATFEVI